MDVKRAAASVGLLLLSGSALACGSDLPINEGTFQLRTEDAMAAECEGAEPAFAAEFEATITDDDEAFEFGLPGGVATVCTVSGAQYYCDPAIVDGDREFHPILETVSWFETTTRINGTVTNGDQFTAVLDNAFRCAGDAEGCALLVQQTTSEVPCEWSQQYDAHRVR